MFFTSNRLFQPLNREIIDIQHAHTASVPVLHHREMQALAFASYEAVPVLTTREPINQSNWRIRRSCFRITSGRGVDGDDDDWGDDDNEDDDGTGFANTKEGQEGGEGEDGVAGEGTSVLGPDGVGRYLVVGVFMWAGGVGGRGGCAWGIFCCVQECFCLSLSRYDISWAGVSSWVNATRVRAFWTWKITEEAHI